MPVPAGVEDGQTIRMQAPDGNNLILIHLQVRGFLRDAAQLGSPVQRVLCLDLAPYEYVAKINVDFVQLVCLWGSYIPSELSVTLGHILNIFHIIRAPVLWLTIV